MSVCRNSVLLSLFFLPDVTCSPVLSLLKLLAIGLVFLGCKILGGDHRKGKLVVMNYETGYIYDKFQVHIGYRRE